MGIVAPLMGNYSEYLKMRLDFAGLERERKKQLKEISKLREGRDVMVFAADLTKQQAQIDYTDILPVQDQLANLSGTAIDVIIETPGGFAEAVEDIISMIRGKYEKVGMIVPGWAKSAGTIFVTAADEILMGTGSALGPIDAQISQAEGKRFSAHAYLEGLTKIKEEVATSGKLNPAYIPILKNISPGEIQQAHNAQEFSERLVTDWLQNYKFKFWEKRRSSGEAVTPEYKKQRANEIAKMLSDQSRWLTHGRSIRIKELEQELNLQIVDYSKMPDLNEAITRYYTLLRMTFETNMYKLFETVSSQIYRYTGATRMADPAASLLKKAPSVHADFQCQKCKKAIKLQANFVPNVALRPGAMLFPANNLIKCPHCATELNMSILRLQLEGQAGRKIV